MTEEYDLPIGIIDSGVGGLTVMQELLQRMPNEHFLYLGDVARCPYGNRTPEEVVAYTKELIEALHTMGVKCVVIACNTATAFALKYVQPLYKFPIIGVIEPGAETAVAASLSKKIVVLGTSGTVKSGAYNRAIMGLAPEAEVIALACPEFVPVVEQGIYKSKKADETVERTLAALKHHTFDTAILGCTHFPLLAPFIENHLPSGTRLITSGAATADAVIEILEEHQLNRRKLGLQSACFYTTGNPESFKAIVEDWLHIENPVVQSLVL